MPAPKPDTDFLEQMVAKGCLPPPQTSRWVARRKAQVVAAVQDGDIGLQQACDFYNLTIEEFLGWHRDGKDAR